MIKLNGHRITPTMFPDKTSQVWKIGLSQPLYGNAVIFWEFEQEVEFIWLAQLVDLIRSTDPRCQINLDMPYYPYARQDKEVSNETTFARTTFIKLMNSLKLNRIESLDVHSNSDFTREIWLFNFQNKSPLEFIQKAVREVGPTLIVFPDKGAETRYKEMLKGIPTLTCEKVRDCRTGDIVGMDIDDEKLLNTDRVLLVDDICDGGRTFIEVAKLLHVVKEIHLYTTHGIYSKGTEVLRNAGIKRIFNYKGEVV